MQIHKMQKKCLLDFSFERIPLVVLLFLGSCNKLGNEESRISFNRDVRPKLNITMNKFLKRTGLALITTLLIVQCSNEEANPPNVVLIMVDDMGYSDIGSYGGEIKTPHLDKLASNGLRFSSFNNAARCWPTRASILTGYYPQQVGRDNAPGIKGGAHGDRPEWASLVPRYLKKAGYRSYHSGKWHLDGRPVESGFDRSYLLGDQGRFFSPQKLYINDQPIPAIERGSGYYATIATAEKAIDHLKEHSESHADKPFFSYIAFTAPHFPLHALPEDIEAVGDRYAEGWDKTREKRWEKIKELGIASGELSEAEPQVGPPYHFADAYEILGDGEENRPVAWESLTKRQKKFQQDKMTIHAAMIERVDKEIGRIVDQLKAMGQLENTLILFLSDNGASAEIMVRDDGHDPNAVPGSATSYLCLGPGWSTTSNTPFRKHKTWVHEGGSCTPLIAHWPKGILGKGELRHTYGHIIDVVPTILDMAGIPADNSFQVDLPGQSLRPVFAKDFDRQDPIWYYHEGHRAIRQGDWKLVAASEQPWELYNLAEDRTESNDLAISNPEKLNEMDKVWTRLLHEIREVAPYKTNMNEKAKVTTENLE